MFREYEFRCALERLLAAYQCGTHEDWREAMRLLAAEASPEQWEEVAGRLRGRERPAVSDAPTVRRRILAADRNAM